MTFLLANWRWIVGIGLIAIYSAFLYRIGGNGPRAELKAYKAQSELLASQAKREKEMADDDYRKKLATYERDFSSLVRKYESARKAVNSRVCEDSPGNAAVSAAVGTYLGEMAEVRTEVIGLARQAGQQEQALECVRDWAEQ